MDTLSKIIITVGVILLAAILIFIAIIAFPYPNIWISVENTDYISESPLPERYEIYTVTENDFIEYPLFKLLMETPGREIVVTDDPITKIVSDKPCMSNAEAYKLREKFGTVNRYLLYDGRYYQLQMIAS